MRRLILLVPFVAACSGGSSTSSVSSAATEFMSVLGDAGVRCLHREPPPFHACDGLDAGAACTVPDDDSDGGVGTCKVIHDGRMLCAGADDDECQRADAGTVDGGPVDGGPADGGLLDGGLAGVHREGDDCMHGDDMPMRWMGWMHDGGLPPPIQGAIDACVGHAVDDPCSVTFRMHGIQGGCKLAPDGKTLVCAPICSQR